MRKAVMRRTQIEIWMHLLMNSNLISIFNDFESES